VLPNFGRHNSCFAAVSFIILDDESHNDNQVLLVGIHPNSFKGSALEIEGTLRVEAEYAVNLPIVFDAGHQGIQGIHVRIMHNDTLPDQC